MYKYNENFTEKCSTKYFQSAKWLSQTGPLNKKPDGLLKQTERRQETRQVLHPGTQMIYYKKAQCASWWGGKGFFLRFSRVGPSGTYT